MSRRKIMEVGHLNIYRDSDTREFVVKPRGDRSDARSYFATDLDDALATAAQQVGGMTRGDVTIALGKVIKKGNQVGTLQHELKHGYHPVVRLRVQGREMVEFEIDTPNLIDRAFDAVVASPVQQ